MGAGVGSWCSVCCSLGDVLMPAQSPLFVCLSLLWLGLYTGGIKLKTIIFIFAIKYAKSQDTQETLKIKWSSKEDFLIDEKTELEIISLLISYIITNWLRALEKNQKYLPFLYSLFFFLSLLL